MLKRAMNRPAQFRCPYTLKPLDQVQQLSDEHIFYEAIGGAQSYSIKADRDENSLLGRTTDGRFVNSKFVELWRAVYGIVGRLEREPRAQLKGVVVGTGEGVDVKIRQGPPIVQYTPAVKIDWAEMTARMTVQADQAEKEQTRLRRDLAAKKVKITESKTLANRYPVFDLKGELKLADVLPGALKVAYLTAFDVLGDPFLDDPLNREWQRVIRARRMVELTIAYLVLGTGDSPKFFPFMIANEPWKGHLPKLNQTEHRVVISNQGQAGVYTVVELLGGCLTISARISRGGNFYLPNGRAKIIICNAIESKIQFEDCDAIKVLERK